MSVIDQEERISKLKKMNNPTSQELRGRVQESAKEFKTSWLKLAQSLYAISRDKLYEYWGYERFDHYVEREVGMTKSMGLKLVKTYAFIEDQEPTYLRPEFQEERTANNMPEFDAINVLRLARGKQELTKQDYGSLRREVFDKGRSAAAVRKELTAIMKERKPVNPDEEREQRKAASVKRFVGAIRLFQRDMEALKLIRADVVEKAKELLSELESEIE